MPAADNTDFDIVIAGGGMIGSSLAVALEPLGFRVAVVEPVARAEREQPSFDERSTALSRSSQRTFEAMGLWPRIAACATPIHSIHVSEKGRFGFSHIDRQEQRVEALGYVVINRVLGEVLGDVMSKQEGLSLVCPARIAAIERNDDGVIAVVESAAGEQRLHCRLLVAADGAGSAVRETTGHQRNSGCAAEGLFIHKGSAKDRWLSARSLPTHALQRTTTRSGEGSALDLTSRAGSATVMSRGLSAAPAAARRRHREVTYVP
jgi:2-polyprenyl-6-methoxyphenol hydroxylase-like FAD-dependent oxidoreductase